MINIKELKGNRFKKELNLYRCSFGFHNKNTTGGNFGLGFYLNKEFNENTDFELYGHYNTEGELLNLKIMSIRCGCFVVPIGNINEMDINGLIEHLKRFYKGLILEGLKW